MTDKTTPLVKAVTQMVRPQPGHRLIFAYDRLMDEQEMSELCPEPKFLMTARYRSHRLIFGADGKANLAPRRGFITHGVIYELSEIALTCLDIRLRVPSNVDRTGCFARSASDQLIVTEFYGSRNYRHGEANAEELSKIIALARYWNFPNEYIDELAEWRRPAGHER